MKKSLVALAALAAAGAASAQSSVTLFGIVDAGVSYYENKTVNGVKLSRTDLSNSGYNSSRIGFRGTEDLGGGLAASFWLEAALGNDVGTAGAGNLTTASSQLFNRRSTVSLSGRFGEVRLGRDYVPTFWNDTVFDPFGTNGVGTNAVSTSGGGTVLGQALGLSNSNYVRANNTVGYFLPANLGGFYGQIMYGLPERVEYDPSVNTPAGLAADGQYIGGRFGYANGPLDVAGAYGETVITRNFQGGGRAESKIGNIGASWDFGFLKLMGEWNQTKVESDLAALTGDLKSNGYLIGGTIPVGPGLIRLSYSYTDFDLSTTATKQKSQKFALGYVHNLSKRTALYATAAYLKNDDISNNGLAMTVGGPTPTAAQSATWGGVEKSMGYDFGIRHSF
ncbi:porin [Variovorax sp. OV329]|uniref:porin n=1 Tax=Variovorax sp. OV329 TaxID=1882825 RepID=UPI0008E49221|nr:porin [Variovorax sp. OV329]SFM17124.1 Outer membrane protein (porin) [Variovorax sp. OV329]